MSWILYALVSFWRAETGWKVLWRDQQRADGGTKQRPSVVRQLRSAHLYSYPKGWKKRLDLGLLLKCALKDASSSCRWIYQIALVLVWFLLSLKQICHFKPFGVSVCERANTASCTVLKVAAGEYLRLFNFFTMKQHALMFIYGSVITQGIQSCIQLVNWMLTEQCPPSRLSPLTLWTHFSTLNTANSASELKSDLKLQGGEAFTAVG